MVSGVHPNFIAKGGDTEYIERDYMDTPPVKSAERTLDVLELLATSEKSLEFGELQRALRIPKSSLHGLIRTLQARGWVESRGTSAQYSLGLRALQLGGSFIQHDISVRGTRACIERLGEATGETVQLGRLDGGEIVYVAQRLSRHPVGLVSSVGQRLPAHATALGKALLADLSNEQVAERLVPPLQTMTSRTHKNLKSLMKDLAGARAAGYAVDREESSLGLMCFAVALPTFEVDSLVAVSISVPIFRLNDALKAKVIDLLLKEKRSMSS